MRSDEEIKRDVEQELARHPDIDADDIAVSVKKGSKTERVAWSAPGVTRVIDQIAIEA